MKYTYDLTATLYNGETEGWSFFEEEAKEAHDGFEQATYWAVSNGYAKVTLTHNGELVAEWVDEDEDE